ncbi:MAG TPA: DUF3352 domain-containing protein [Solirubrobacteraceae bacterium]|nr:DUF3352 domain-containing protein [Solirubrobacteraceae bacterium]
MSRTLRVAAPFVLLAVVAALLAGCGSSATGSSRDPAEAVPASAALYAGAVVRPQGSLQEAARVAGRKLTHQANPYLRLLGALQTPGAGRLDFDRDVAPWLGPKAGAFLGSGAEASEAAVSRVLNLVVQALLGRGAGGFPFAAHSLDGAVVLDTRDSAKARSFVQTLAKRAGAHGAGYRGVAYQVANGIAFALVSRLVVIGTEPALHEVIDTVSGGGLSLAHSPGYAKLQSAAPGGTLAHLYANPGALSEATGKLGAKGSGSALSLLAGQRLLNASLVPSKSSFALDVDAVAPEGGGSSGGLVAPSPQAAQALGELPGESWLAIGLGDLGKTLAANPKALQGLSSLGGLLTGSGSAPATGLSVTAIVEGLLKPLTVLGADPAETKRDFASWMGPTAIFTSGSGLLELRGGVVIDSTDPGRSRAAVAKMGELLRAGGGSVERAKISGTDAAMLVHVSGLPVELAIADGRDAGGATKFVIGIGEQSVEAALRPSSTLSGSASYGTSAAALGQGFEPSLIVEFPTLLGLLEGVGLSEDPTVSPFVPYLRTLGTLSGGGKDLGGGIERYRLVLGLGESG